MSLKQKTIKGLFWSGTSQAGKQISQFIITAILARLLSPDDFGLLAMATVFVNFVSIFSEMGVSSALIQKQDTHDRHYYSAFWLNVVVGLGLTILFISISPLIAAFYKKPQLTYILSALSVNFFLSSFVIIQQTLLTKEMDFKKLAIRNTGAVIFAGIVGIFLAYKGFGVWSLVFQSIVFSISDVILLWSVSPWRPKFQFATSDIKDIFHFSANLTGFNIVNYFARNIDQLLIGKFLGTRPLGYYSLAYKIMLYPLQNISWVISKVMFPAFSKIQDNPEKIRNAYLIMVKFVSLIAFPLMALIFVIAPEFVRIFFGAKWENVIILIRIFCICGLVQSIGTLNGTIYLSKGHSDIQFKLQVLATIVVTIAVISGMRWGVVGVASFYTIQTFAWFVFAFHVAHHLIKLKAHIFYSQFKEALLLCLYIVPLLFIESFRFPLYYSFTIKCVLGLCIFAVFILTTRKIDAIKYNLSLFKS